MLVFRASGHQTDWQHQVDPSYEEETTTKKTKEEDDDDDDVEAVVAADAATQR